MQPGLIAFPFFTVKYLRTTLDSNYSLYEAIKDGAGFDDRRRTSSAGRVWQDHKDMVRQALRVSIPWFTFVNISFALIILFRHILISDFDKSISAQTGILPLIDDIMGSIIVFSFLILLSFTAFRPDLLLFVW